MLKFWEKCREKCRLNRGETITRDRRVSSSPRSRVWIIPVLDLALPAGVHQSPSLRLVHLAAPPPLLHTSTSLRRPEGEGPISSTSLDSSALPNCVVYQNTCRSDDGLSVLAFVLTFHRKYFYDLLNRCVASAAIESSTC